MRIILKLITIPIVIILTLFVWLCSGLLYCSAYLLGLAGTLVGFLALLVLLSGNVTNALILAFIAFLIGPLGVPMAAAWLLGKIQELRFAIQSL